MKGAGHGSMKKHSHLQKQAKNAAKHASAMNALSTALGSFSVTKTGATKHRLSSQRSSQKNPFAILRQKIKGKQLTTINELNKLLGKMTSKFSTTRRSKKDKMIVLPTRRSIRHIK